MRHAARTHRTLVTAAVAAVTAAVVAVLAMSVGAGALEPPAGPAASGRAVAAAPAEAPRNRPAAAEPARVAAVGDSLLYNLDTETSAYTDIAYRDDGAFTDAVTAAGHRPVLVSGHPGYATAQLTDQVADAVAARPDVLVFVSGSNEALDVAAGQAPTPDAASMASEIRSALDEMSGIGCVVWPTVTTQPNMFWGADTAVPSAVNEVLRDEAARRPNLRLVEWDDLAAGHLAGSADPWYMADGLHHTAAGEAAFEAAILDEVAGCTHRSVMRTLPGGTPGDPGPGVDGASAPSLVERP